MDSAGTDAGALTVRGGPAFDTVTRCDTVVVQLPETTTAEYVVLEVGETVIDIDVAPVDHATLEMPEPTTVSVAVPVPHRADGPLISTLGAGVTVTGVGAEVAVHRDGRVRRRGRGAVTAPERGGRCVGGQLEGTGSAAVELDRCVGEGAAQGRGPPRRTG